MAPEFNAAFKEWADARWQEAELSAKHGPYTHIPEGMPKKDPWQHFYSPATKDLLLAAMAESKWHPPVVEIEGEA